MGILISFIVINQIVKLRISRELFYAFSLIPYFLGQLSRLDEEFVSGLKEFVPFVCNDATDDTSQCPTIKIDPMAERMTADDFIDQVFKT